MNSLVMITENYDGKVSTGDLRWCAFAYFDTVRTLCGETLDEASHYRAEHKTVVRGGITCHQCLSIVRAIKSIKL